MSLAVVSPSPIRRVEWLAHVLDLTPEQTHEAIRAGQVPPDAVVRVGRRIRINAIKIAAWLGVDLADLPLGAE